VSRDKREGKEKTGKGKEIAEKRGKIVGDKEGKRDRRK
jgi:hypothetical protein